MIFNSLQFLWFFPLAVFVWFSSPRRYKPYVLLGMSLWFYAAANPVFLFVLLLSIISAWAGGMYIRASRGKSQKAVFIFSILVPLGMLAGFKYYNFTVETVMVFVRRMNLQAEFPAMRMALPVGISFFTFKAVSYLADINSGKLQAERNIIKVANYIAFFPQILAGPIERAGRFIPQLDKDHKVDPVRFRDGLGLIMWGLFKKIVIADNLAMIVNVVYAAPENYPGLALIVATYCYAFQIFCDFSGYSDMAIGAARVMGFSTMKNFNRPYAAVSVSDFWRRWHISLSTWFRDYVYIPLGGSRVNLARWILNVLIVFLISGLWHGAAWTFIIWGGIHGLFLVIERITAKPAAAILEVTGLKRFPKAVRGIRVFFTFHLVTFSWIFFRAKSIADARYIAANLFDGLRMEVLNLFSREELMMAGVLILLLMAVQQIRARHSALQWLLNRPAWLRWVVYIAMAAACINLRPVIQSGFIYLQF